MNNSWGQCNVSSGISNRPSTGSFTEARDQQLGFFFNGQLDSGSSSETENLGDAGKVFIEGMTVVNTSDHTARNLSTKAVVGDMPRSRSRMQFVDNIGKHGILVQIGGNQKLVSNTTDQHVGNLVSGIEYPYMREGEIDPCIFIRFHWMRLIFSTFQASTIPARLTVSGTSRRRVASLLLVA